MTSRVAPTLPPPPTDLSLAEIERMAGAVGDARRAKDKS
jgi:hypothetical protein